MEFNERDVRIVLEELNFTQIIDTEFDRNREVVLLVGDHMREDVGRRDRGFYHLEREGGLALIRIPNSNQITELKDLHDFLEWGKPTKTGNFCFPESGAEAFYYTMREDYGGNFGFYEIKRKVLRPRNDGWLWYFNNIYQSPETGIVEGMFYDSLGTSVRKLGSHLRDLL